MQNEIMDKFSLRAYLRKINLRDAKSLEEKSGEIMTNIKNAMAPYLKSGERVNTLRAYYTPPVKQIEEAFIAQDFKKSFPNALEYLISSIDYE